MAIIESFKSDSLTVRVCTDDEPMNPREWDNVGKMVCWHRAYDLGDEQPSCSPYEYSFQLMCDRELEKHRKYLPDEDSVGEENIRKYIEKHFYVLPLHLYDHGGIKMSTSKFYCPWDSGLVGFIYAPKECEEYDDMRKGLIAEVEVYDRYLQGDFYAYDIMDEQGEVLDSCAGFDNLLDCKRQGEIEAKSLSQILCVAACI